MICRGEKKINGQRGNSPKTSYRFSLQSAFNWSRWWWCHKSMPSPGITIGLVSNSKADLPNIELLQSVSINLWAIVALDEDTLEYSLIYYQGYRRCHSWRRKQSGVNSCHIFRLIEWWSVFIHLTRFIAPHIKRSETLSTNPEHFNVDIEYHQDVISEMCVHR